MIPGTSSSVGSRIENFVSEMIPVKKLKNWFLEHPPAKLGMGLAVTPGPVDSVVESIQHPGKSLSFKLQLERIIGTKVILKSLVVLILFAAFLLFFIF